MPGKQLAIDADLASGAITHEEATRKRKIEQEETTFFGSLDGASKFVKGDAVAGLMITAINFFFGIAMGTIYYDMSMSDAMKTYSLLTIGDGLVTQIPAVVTSIASALLMAKGGAHGTSDSAMVKQLVAYPPAVYTVAAVMGVMSLIPGLPFLPFITGAALIAYVAYVAAENQKKQTQEDKLKQDKQQKLEEIKTAEKTLGDFLEVDDVWIEFSPNLIGIATDKQEGIAVRIEALRKAMAADLGFILPEIRLTDNTHLSDGEYIIKIQGVSAAKATLRPGWQLVIKQDGIVIPCQHEDTVEPVYQAPAAWVRDIDKDKVAVLGLPIAGVNDIIATHLTETVKSNMRELVTRSAVNSMLNEFTKVSDSKRAERNKKILDEFIPDIVSRDLLHHVIRLLLEERVSVRNIPIILEAISEAKHFTEDPEKITERVRRKLSLQISSELTDHEGTIPLVQIGNEWEQIFRQYEIRDNSGTVQDVALPPAEITNLAAAINNKLQEVGRQGRYASVTCAGERRRLIRAIMDAKQMRQSVIAYEEIHSRTKPALLAVI
jgi:flagellar biosynthesis protein FlhA